MPSVSALPPPTLIWVAGWGMAADVFAPCQALLPEYYHHNIFLWGEDAAVLPNFSPPLIGIGHSMGGWWLAQQPAMQTLITIGGFQRFPAGSRVLTPMRQAFDHKPKQVLLSFYAKSGCSDYPPPAVHLPRLAHALDRLTHEQVAFQPRLAIHGEKDAIVPLYHAQRDFLSLRVLPNAGHVPQWTHPEQTATLIRETLCAER
ncbi:MAG: alpha/beta fold hydrolase [Holosporales bacterium]|jgi:pimeloyl-ACP methyl ester carboxylesterase